MKTIILSIFTLFALSLTVLGQTLTYTTTVNSSPGQNYSVNVTIVLTDIVSVQNNCSNGYNYDVAYDYDVDIVHNGNNNISLNTLQGYLTCGSNSGIYFDLPNSGGSGSSVTQGNPWNSNSDCATSTVESLQCNTIELQVQGPGISSQLITLNPNTTLPVEWLSFEVRNENNSAELYWSTASEKNNDYFTVERSIDGINWVSLTEIEGAGNTNSTSSYSWKDTNPKVGDSYYRIKQTDFDGQTDYSSVQSITIEGGEIQVYPNPGVNIVNIKSENSNSNSEIVILNSFGQNVTNRVTEVNSNKIDISNLPTGFYTIILNGSYSKFQKL